jgi:pyruvate dehydrogenase (quinone)
MHDGPALVEVHVHRQELSMPPTITLEQAAGFGLFTIKAVLNGRDDELINLARSISSANGVEPIWLRTNFASE